MTLDRYRRRGGKPADDPGAEQLLEFAWRVAGATMAALGVPRENLQYFGKLVEPTIQDLVGDSLLHDGWAWGMSREDAPGAMTAPLPTEESLALFGSE